jgi:hypothetical protein
MRKLAITALLVLLTFQLFSQNRPYRFGVKAGLNYIHLENYGSGYYSDFDPKPGFTVGALFEYRMGGFLNYSIAPEVLFTQSVTDVDLLYITDCVTTIQSIDIPVNFKLGLRLSKIFRPYVLGNVYASIVIKDYGDFWELMDIDYSSASVTTINKFFFGVSTGLGFDLWKFQLEGRYRWNLNRIQTDDYSALKQMGLEFSLAFLF